MITKEIKDFMDLQKLGYVATVTPDGRPNLSPKGSIIGWDEHTLAFADIRSPDTLTNLRHSPHVEVNVVDPLLRKGYLFQGKGRIISEGPMYDEIVEHYRNNGIKSPIGAIVLIDVSNVSEVTSPLYDLGISEQDIKAKWKKYFESM